MARNISIVLSICLLSVFFGSNILNEFSGFASSLISNNYSVTLGESVSSDNVQGKQNNTTQTQPSERSSNNFLTTLEHLTNQATHTIMPTKADLYQVALDDINSYRTQNGLKPVSLANSPASQAYADLLLSEKCIHHMNDDGTTPQGRFHALGQDSYVIAENVEGGTLSVSVQTTVKQFNYNMMFNDHLVKDGGLNVGTIDNGHRMNILNPDHQYVSLGIAYNLNNVVLVEDFEDPILSNEYIPSSSYVDTPDPKSCW